MSNARKFRAVKGVRDILPPDTSLWNWFEQTAREVLESYNYREIRLPTFEQTELFARSVGADTDIVCKEMYTLEEEEILPERPAIEGDWFRRFPDWVQDVKTLYLKGQIKKSDDFERVLKEIDFFLDKGPQPGLPEDVFPRVLNGLAFELDDIVRAESYESLALRPEATASVVRAYIEHGMHTLPGDVKLYYMGPMFRRERPQKGRYRQFYQIGAEVLGQSDHSALDAELVEMLTVLLERCQIDRWTLLVNSIGCQNCRAKFVETLKQALAGVKSRMCADCQHRAETNPLRVFDCKVEADQPIIEELPTITDHLDEPCRQHFAELKRQLDLRQIPYTVAPRLVRGLDYYMRTTFEITSPVLGAQNALVGGGRYDGLSELLGGPPTKGIGFALGTDRFVEAIKAAGKVDAAQPLDIFVAWMGSAAYPVAVKLARRLRDEGFSVELPPEEMKLKKSLGLADKLGARYAVILGEDEVKAGNFTVKRLEDSEQRKVFEAELVEYLKAGPPGRAGRAGRKPAAT